MTPKKLATEAVKLLTLLEKQYGKVPIDVLEMAISLYWHSQANKKTK
jgi:hypothetical protein